LADRIYTLWINFYGQTPIQKSSNSHGKAFFSGWHFLIVDLASKPMEASKGVPENLRFISVLNTYIRTRNSGI